VSQPQPTEATAHREEKFAMQTTQSQATTTRPKPTSILQSQRQAWNRFSTGWEKWDDFTMRFLQPQGDAILGALDLPDGSRVLDIAAGTGDPGLTLASRRRAIEVTALDASEGMLRIARDKAKALELTNFQTVVGDACALDFADQSFDAVSCRLGLMFFPDPQQAVREMARVLRPGGVLAATVWAAPSDNRWLTTFMGALGKRVELPSPPPGGPGLFRCADPDALRALFDDAGLCVERTGLLQGYMRCASSEQYWAFMNDVVPPVVAALGDAPAELVASVKADVVEALGDVSLAAPKTLAWGAHWVAGHK
jgi:ubiquinone/menaquinone biosynthesis C-methylase UbiE